MSLLSTLAVNFGRVATFIQVLFYLPLALDIAGQDAFLALSASLASYYFFLSTIRLLTRRTRLAWIGQTLAIFQFVVIPACLLVCCNVYSPPSTTIFPPRQSELGGNVRRTGTVIGSIIHSARSGDAAASFGFDDASTGSATLDSAIRSAATAFFYLARHVPGWWHLLLRLSSPLFSLLEGVASLLVIQSLASTSRWIIASSLAAPSTRYQTQGGASAAAATAPPRGRWFSDALLFRSLSSLGFGASEVWQIFFLLISATTYVSAALALYVSFEGATKDRPGTAAAIATSVTSTVWLTVIAFAIRKGNVIETSLMFAYVVFNIYQLGPSLSFTPDPISLIRSFKANTHGAAFVESLPSSLQAPLPSKILQTLGTLLEVIAHWLGQSVDFLNAAGAALPKSVIVSLVYRLMVLYAASRILPMLKGSVASPSKYEENGPTRRGSWGKTSGAKFRTTPAGDAAPEGGVGQGDGEARRRWSQDEQESSESGSESDLEESEAEIEEYEEEVWDEDEGRWILQKRRRTIRRRRRPRGRYADDGFDDDEEDDGSDSQTDPWIGEAEGEAFSEDDSGIAYNDSAKKSAASRKLPAGESDADPAGLKEPAPVPTEQREAAACGEVVEDKETVPAEAAPASSGVASGNKRRAAKASRNKSGRRDDLQTPLSAGNVGSPKQSPSDLGMNSARVRKRRRDASGSSTASTTSSAYRHHRHPKRRHRSSPTGSIYADDDGEDEEQQEPFGAFISILVSYSRLVLIAVYSHLLLLDQSHQIYWRFLTVGLTLTLWGLELVISKEDEVDVGGGGEMLAR